MNQISPSPSNIPILGHPLRRVLGKLGKLIMFSRCFALITFLMSLGCTSAVKIEKPSNTGVFHGTLAEVMEAAEKAIAKYPIAENSAENGLIKTEALKGKNCFSPPDETNNYSAGVRCTLTLYFSKMAAKKTRVRIQKNIEVVRDFISDPEPLENRGFEELLILYRIERELNLRKN